MRLHVGALLGLLLLSIVGCSSAPRGDIAYNRADFGRPDAAKPDVDVGPYKLAPQDKFHVTVYRVPDLTRDYQVESGGTVSFPLIGVMSVLGLTSDQLERELTKRYGERYLREPSVSVRIDQMTSGAVTIEGAVRTPQVLQINGHIDLLEAVAKASGLDPDANPSRIVVFRTIGGGRQAAAFDLRRIREGIDPNPVIYGGDTIVVDGSTLRKNLRDTLLAVPLIGIFAPLL